jgi:hypothetical protein
MTKNAGKAAREDKARRIVIDAFADLDLNRADPPEVTTIPLYRMISEKEKIALRTTGRRYLVLFESESFAVDGFDSDGADSAWQVGRGAGRVWRDAIGKLYRRKSVKRIGRHELRCLDVPAVHRGFLWIHVPKGEDSFLCILDHGEAASRRRLINFARVSKQMRLALDQKHRGFERMKMVMRERAGKN